MQTPLIRKVFIRARKNTSDPKVISDKKSNKEKESHFLKKLIKELKDNNTHQDLAFTSQSPEANSYIHLYQEIVKAEAEVTKLRHDFEELKQQTQVITNVQDTSSIGGASTTENISPNSSPNENLSNERNNASNSDVCQKLITQCSALPIHAESKSLEVKEINNFLDRKEKEKVSNIMRDINREKKLLRSNKDSTFRTQEALLTSQDTPSIESEQMPIDQDIPEAPINQAQGTIIAGNEPAFSSKIAEASATVLKFPYNQRVEQGLIRELSAFIDEKSLSNSISDKLITVNMPDRDDLTPDISSKNNINDQMAKMQIYDEMGPYLPGNAHVIEPFISNDSEKLPATETLCPLCELNHEDEEGVEGRYEAGSYYIKCEQ
ncbi:10264_t:CDS:2, partial [Entrophospora sp. SA101]